MRVNKFLNPWVSEFKAGLFVWMCPMGLGLTKAKKGARNVEVCLLVKHTHTDTHTHTHTHINIKDFLYYCSPLTILEFLNFLWGKREFWNHKVFWKKWILQNILSFPFPFSPPATPQTMSSVQFLTQTTINGDTHSEGVFFESLLFVENKGVGEEQEPNVFTCGAWSLPEPVAIFKRNLSCASVLGLQLVLVSLFACSSGLF